MNGWNEWRDGVTLGVFVVVTLFGLIGACNHREARTARETIKREAAAAAEEARKDSSPIIETCVKHPSARKVVVR